MTVEQFRDELRSMLAEAQAKGFQALEVEAGSLHRRIGVYPARDHSMPTCCSAMRKAMQPGDEILAEPPKGAGATLKIRYRLPRQ